MKEKTIFALGFFDGVHLGHQALLKQCVRLAEETGAIPAAVTFSAHPQALTRGESPLLINTAADRERLLRRYGMEKIIVLPFDEALRQMPWQNFFRLLTEEYGGAGLVCGSDFRFGYQGRGNAQLLQQACDEVSIPCVVVPQQEIEGIRVSSTYIRQLLELGQMERAVAFLGHPHTLSGNVQPGRQLGRTIGIPTANLVIPQGVVTPKFGVYACKAKLPKGEEYLAVTNIGCRPTVDGRGVTVEAWLLDFDGDLYGRELTLEFHAFLRGEEKFPNLQALSEEIQKNGVQTRQFFGKK